MTKDIQKLQPNKERIVDLYRETKGNISNTMRAADLHRTTFYLWKEKDPAFKLAIEEADAEIRDEMEQLLFDHTADGNTGTLIFWLKNRHPYYKQNYGTTVAARTDGETIEVVVTDYK